MFKIYSGGGDGRWWYVNRFRCIVEARTAVRNIYLNRRYHNYSFSIVWNGRVVDSWGQQGRITEEYAFSSGVGAVIQRGGVCDV